MKNPVGWFEIYVQDMNRAKKFYESVFNTKLEKLEGSDMKDIELWAFGMEQNKYGAPGALVKMKGAPSGHGGTLVYFACEDCAHEEKLVTKSGGMVFKPKFPIGQYGFISLVNDTEGNMIGLHSMK